jgi:hypothetical protein
MHRVITVLVGLAVLGATTQSVAAPVTYTLVPSQSVLSLSGNLFGFPFLEQKAGSLTAQYSGTITADLSGGVLTFGSGTSIMAGAFSADSPFNPTDEGGANDVYGGTASFVEAAFYNIQIAILGGTIEDGVAPTTLNLGWVEDINGDGVGGFRSTLGDGDLTGDANNQTVELASLTTNGGVETLTFHIFSPNPVEQNDVVIGSIDMSGWITATRSVQLPGDANGDGFVNGADYTIWADNFQKAGGFAQGDFNGDGKVDGADYTIWADNFTPGSAAVPVPEPTSLVLAAMGMIGLALGLRRRS